MAICGEGTLEKIRPSGSSLGLLLGLWPPGTPTPLCCKSWGDGTTGMVALPWAGFSGFRGQACPTVGASSPVGSLIGERRLWKPEDGTPKWRLVLHSC